MTSCKKCGLERTPEGHDGCLGTLPGVMNACCGHEGNHEGTYIQFLDGSIIGGDDAFNIMKIMVNADVSHPETLIDARKVRAELQRKYEEENRWTS